MFKMLKFMGLGLFLLFLTEHHLFAAEPETRRDVVDELFFKSLSASAEEIEARYDRVMPLLREERDPKKVLNQVNQLVSNLCRIKPIFITFDPKLLILQAMTSVAGTEERSEKRDAVMLFLPRLINETMDLRDLPSIILGIGALSNRWNEITIFINDLMGKLYKDYHVRMDGWDIERMLSPFSLDPPVREQEFQQTFLELAQIVIERAPRAEERPTQIRGRFARPEPDMLARTVSYIALVLKDMYAAEGSFDPDFARLVRYLGKGVTNPVYLVDIIMKTLQKEVPRAERESVVNETVRIILPTTPALDRQQLITLIYEIPRLERESVVSEALRLSSVSVKPESVLLEVARLPVDRREERVNLAVDRLNRGERFRDANDLRNLLKPEEEVPSEPASKRARHR
jgi:hypothetical protein